MKSISIKNRSNPLGTIGYIFSILFAVFLFIFPPISTICGLLGILLSLIGLIYGLIGGKSIITSLLGIIFPFLTVLALSETLVMLYNI
jgi:hypothetical protein